MIKNKKILSDLLEKGKEYQDNEGFENNKQQSTDTEEDEETASEKSQSQETENSDLEAESEMKNSDSESTTTNIQQKYPNLCQHCEGSNVYHTAVMKCPKYFWHDNREICSVCRHNIAMDQKHMKEEIKRCFDSGADTLLRPEEIKRDFSPS